MAALALPRTLQPIFRVTIRYEPCPPHEHPNNGRTRARRTNCFHAGRGIVSDLPGPTRSDILKGIFPMQLSTHLCGLLALTAGLATLVGARAAPLPGSARSTSIGSPSRAPASTQAPGCEANTAILIASDCSATECYCSLFWIGTTDSFPCNGCQLDVTFVWTCDPDTLTQAYSCKKRIACNTSTATPCATNCPCSNQTFCTIDLTCAQCQ